MNLDIKQTQREVHLNSRAKGFWDDPTLPVAVKLMLIVSELAEAMEADRNQHYAYRSLDSQLQLLTLADKDELKDQDRIVFEQTVKNTFEDELADAVIRIFDLAEYMKIDLESHIKAKHAYNKGRPHKHGKNY